MYLFVIVGSPVAFVYLYPYIYIYLYSYSHVYIFSYSFIYIYPYEFLESTVVFAGWSESEAPEAQEERGTLAADFQLKEDMRRPAASSWKARGGYFR